MSSAEIKTRAAAEHLLRWTARLPPTGGWSDDKWIACANRHAARLSDEHVAAVMRGFSTKHIKFPGAVCQKCGARLSAPESVAAGVGPECMSA